MTPRRCGPWEGIRVTYWCPNATPLLFGTSDERFTEAPGKDVILKAHKHVVVMIQERYRLPDQEEREQGKKACDVVVAGRAIDVTEGYALVHETYKPLVYLEEDITWFVGEEGSKKKSVKAHPTGDLCFHVIYMHLTLL